MSADYDATHPATATCEDSCPTWLHSRATCCHMHAEVTR